MDRASSILTLAIGLPPDRRSALLAAACGDDEDLRRDVERMLDANPDDATAVFVPENGDTSRQGGSDTQRGRLQVRCPNCHAPMEVAVDSDLTDLTCGSCGSEFSLVGASETTGSAVPLAKMGRFELVGRLGMGAFGAVWKARDKELDRAVAIKIPRQGGMTSQEQEYFFREARAAAQLRHPNIVSVHEVGRDGDSVYIVSDFVRGVTLSDWLTGQQLTGREAAALCAKIAHALQHAHEKGVVHRDLKPANIMIDGEGEPHLMDFGLARREVGEVTVTFDGQILGTPAYMSPEQAQGESHQADSRSDIYSVGVILFQLLTGELPFRGNARMLLHQVVHDEPPSPRKLNGNVAKDLETIALKCMEKDPAKRYQSARELAEEFERFLAGKPILARPVSHAERTLRWARRNKTVSAVSTLAVLALVGGTVASTLFALDARWQANVARANEENALNAKRAADRAREQEVQARKNAETVTAFLVSAFQTTDPTRNGRTITVAEILDQAEDLVDEELGDDPLTAANLLLAIGEARSGLGLIQEAVGPFLKANQLREKALGQDDLETLYAMSLLAMAYDQSGHLEKAIPLQETVVEKLKLKRGAAHRDTLTAINNLATMYLNAGRYGESVALIEATISAAKEELGAEHPEYLACQGNLAAAYQLSGRYDEAVSLLEQVAAAKTNSFGATHASTLRTMSNLAIAYEYADRHQEAAALGEKTLPPLREVFGEDHPMTLTCMHNLALSYGSLNRHKEALDLNETSLALHKEKMGADHPATLGCMYSLADNYSKLGRETEGVELLEQMIPRLIDRLGEDHPYTLNSKGMLADFYHKMGRHAETLELRIATLEGRKEKLGSEHPDTLTALNNLASTFSHLHRYQEARTHYQEAFERRKTTLGSDHPSTLNSMYGLAHTYAALGQHAQAIELQEEVLDRRKSKLGPSHLDTLKSMRDLASSLSAVGRSQEALELSNEELELRISNYGSNDHETLRCMNSLGWMLATCNDDRVRDGPRALELVGETARLTDYRIPEILVTLAAAYAETGDFKSAVKWSEAALEALGENGDSALRQEITKALENYKSEKPWRQGPSQIDPSETAVEEGQ